MSVVFNESVDFSSTFAKKNSHTPIEPIRTSLKNATATASRNMLKANNTFEIIPENASMIKPAKKGASKQSRIIKGEGTMTPRHDAN
jgi:hypothetical protein